MSEVKNPATLIASNSERARFGKMPLRMFSEMSGADAAGDWEHDRAAVVAEMMTCVLHYCSLHRLDGEEIVNRALRTWRDDVEEEARERKAA